MSTLFGATSDRRRIASAFTRTPSPFGRETATREPVWWRVRIVLTAPETSIFLVLQGLSGGAGSLERTRLCANSLFNREKTGNFYKIRAFWGLGPQVSLWKYAVFLVNSLKTITGNFFVRTGNLFEETGN
jgi:hypothetical protein